MERCDAIPVGPAPQPARNERGALGEPAPWAVGVVRKFKWTAKDQNSVAFLIGGKKMKPDKAAAVWVKANPGKVNSWLKK